MQKINEINQKYLIYGLIGAIALYFLWNVFVLLCISFVLAGILRPIHKLFLRLRINQSVSAVLSVFMLIYFIKFALEVLIPLTIDQVYMQIDFLKENQHYIQNTLNSYIEKFRIPISRYQDSIVSFFTNQIELMLGLIFGFVSAQGLSLINAITKIIIVIPITFFFVRDWSKWQVVADKYLSKPLYENTLFIFTNVEKALGNWIAAQLILMSIMSVFYIVSLYFISFPYYLYIGILSGFSSLVPYIGALFVFFLALLIEMNNFVSWEHIIYITTIFIVGNLFESNVLSFYITGNKVKISPLLLFIYIISFAYIFGALSMFFALPIIVTFHTILKTIIVQKIERQESKK